jgi:hypothetical protein
MNYRLLADDIEVWKGTMRPTQNLINKVYEAASNDGWNGISLLLYRGFEFIEEVKLDEYEGATL